MQPTFALTLIDTLKERNPDALRLARLASFAAELRGELLRELRLHFMPRSDASVEADLWLSEIVASRNSRGIVLLPVVIEHLRKQLAEPPKDEHDPRFGKPLHHEVWAFLSQRHPKEPPLIKLEEELTWLGFTKATSDLVDRKLGEVIRVLMTDPTRERDLAAWSRRTLPSLPESIRRTRGAWLLALGASARLQVPTVLGGPPPDGLTASEVRELFPKSLGEVALEIRRTAADELQLGEAGPTSLADALRILVPRTRPLLLEILAGDVSAAVVSVEAGQWPSQQLPAGALARGEVSVRTLTGECWRIQPEAAATDIIETDAAVVRKVAWLHVTDPQVGGQVVAPPVAAIVRQARQTVLPIELLLVTGDVSFRASAKDFDTAIAWFSQAVAETHIAPVVLAVPGNHDFDAALASTMSTASIADDDVFWTSPSHVHRVELEEVFKEYRTFQGKALRLGKVPTTDFVSGILPGDFSVTVASSHGRVGVVGLNTIFATPPRRGQQRLQVFSARQLDFVTQNDPGSWAARHDLTLLLTHHPPRALSKAVRGGFEERIAAFFDLHLCGATDEAGAIEPPPGEAGPVLLQAGPFRAEKRWRFSLGTATLGTQTRVKIESHIWDIEKHQFEPDLPKGGRPADFSIWRAASAPAGVSGPGAPLEEVKACWAFVQDVMLAYHVHNMTAGAKSDDDLALPHTWSKEQAAAIHFDAEWPTMLAVFFEPEIERQRSTLAERDVVPRTSQGELLSDVELLIWMLEAFGALIEATGAEASHRPQTLSAAIPRADLVLLAAKQSKRFSIRDENPSVDRSKVRIEFGYETLVEVYGEAVEQAARMFYGEASLERLREGEEAKSEIAAVAALAEATLSSLPRKPTNLEVIVRGTRIGPRAADTLGQLHPSRVFRPDWLDVRAKWQAAGLCRGHERAAAMAALELEHFETALRAAVPRLRDIAISTHRLKTLNALSPAMTRHLRLGHLASSKARSKQSLLTSPTSLLESFARASRVLISHIESQSNTGIATATPRLTGVTRVDPANFVPK